MKSIQNILFIIIFSSFSFSQCPDNYIESNQSTINTIICIPTLFEHSIALQQAGYLFFQVDIEGILIDNNDWVGAFNGEQCVGAIQWNLNECNNDVCSINIYGNDGHEYSNGYMLPDEYPDFRIYDHSENMYYSANPSLQEPWFNFNFSFINRLTTFEYGCIDSNACNFDSLAGADNGSCEYDSDGDGTCDSIDICPGEDDFLDTDGDMVVDCMEILGCMNSSASNYNSDATDDNQDCTYSFDIDHHPGANLVSYLILPLNELSYPYLDFINLYYSESSIYSMLNASNASLYYENIGWLGSLINIKRDSGYWIKIDNAETISFDGYKTDDEIIYPLLPGPNLISFPSELIYDFSLFYEALTDAGVDTIFSEGYSAYYSHEMEGWFGSLNTFEGFKGYWFIANESVDFSFDLGDGGLARSLNSTKAELYGFEYNQSSSQAFYYVKEIPGIEEGDWLIAYNDDVVIGTREWAGYMTDIPVMGNDGDYYSIGYIENDESPKFKLYQSRTGRIIDLYGQVPDFSNNEIFILDKLYNNDKINVPSAVTLNSAYPNPFNPVTNIRFSVPDQMHVELNILDIQGRIVDRLVQDTYDFGNYEVVFNAGNLSSGVYFIQLLTEKDIKYTKIILLK